MTQTTRLIYWNESAGGWYDVQTDVNVKNMTAPTDEEDPDAPLSESLMRYIAMQAITDRAVSKHVYYFAPPPDALVTYDWLSDQRQQLMGEIYQLQHRVAQLERPWWKIW